MVNFPLSDFSIDDLLARMTLAEKVGQMTQVEKNSLTPADVAQYGIGSVLSGGGGAPDPNTPEGWVDMVEGFQRGALRSRLEIPLLYGVDAVHGHNNLLGATIFPHNIGLGAARDPRLVQRIAHATGEALAATGIRWNFAPMVAVPQDIRWGRTYECYGEEPGRVAELGAAFVRGSQGECLGDPRSVLATPKHFIGDGGTGFGSSTTTIQDCHYRLDQGDACMDEATLRRLFLPPYRAAMAAGALCIMVTHSSWNGHRVLASRYLLTEVLKGELAFEGFLVSDWQSVDLIDGDYYAAVVTAVNAGVDMVMVPFDFRRFIATLCEAVERGQVPMGRIDDAVRRILGVKRRLGLFEHPLPDRRLLPLAHSVDHKNLAREAVRRSLVLLKNEGGTLPIGRSASLIHVGGVAADDVGLQCGGWTIEWQGRPGPITPGTTLLEGIRSMATGRVAFDPAGHFDAVAEIGIAVVSELPYAEGFGDVVKLGLSDADRCLISSMRRTSQRLLVVVISGRPLILGDVMGQADAVIAAWLPGTEGSGVAELIFGDFPFTGRLPLAWPGSLVPASGGAPLFPCGFGLTTP